MAFRVQLKLETLNTATVRIIIISIADFTIIVLFIVSLYVLIVYLKLAIVPVKNSSGSTQKVSVDQTAVILAAK
jgi:hypothetical protein